MARAHRGGIRGCFQTPVIPVDDIADAEAMTGVEGVLALARAGGEMGKRFEAFCRTNLCMESWDFIVDVLRYEVVRACLSVFHCFARSISTYAYAYDDPPTKNVNLLIVCCVSNFSSRVRAPMTQTTSSRSSFKSRTSTCCLHLTTRSTSLAPQGGAWSLFYQGEGCRSPTVRDEQ